MKRVLAAGIFGAAVCLVGCGSPATSDEPPVEYYEPPPDPGQYLDEPVEPDFAFEDCDPNYDGGCVPLVAYDLDCPDIEGPVYVIGYDVHRFDRDGNGIGCEPYP